MSQSSLHRVGISEKEQLIYETLLKTGEISISLLITQTKLKRASIYKIIYSLEKKGLVTMRDINKKLHVKPESPTKLLEITQNHYRETEIALKNIQSVIPQFNLLYSNSTVRPVVKTFEGADGLKKMYEDHISEGKPIYAILQASDVDPDLYQWLRSVYVKKRLQKKIHIKAIVASSKESRDYIQKSPKEFRIAIEVDSKLFPFQHEIDIYGDKISIFHHKQNEPFIGIVMQHPQIAASMKAWFDLAWVGANLKKQIKG